MQAAAPLPKLQLPVHHPRPVVICLVYYPSYIMTAGIAQITFIVISRPNWYACNYNLAFHTKYAHQYGYGLGSLILNILHSAARVPSTAGLTERTTPTYIHSNLTFLQPYTAPSYPGYWSRLFYPRYVALLSHSLTFDEWGRKKTICRMRSPEGCGDSPESRVDSRVGQFKLALELILVVEMSPNSVDTETEGTYA